MKKLAISTVVGLLLFTTQGEYSSIPIKTGRDPVTILKNKSYYFKNKKIHELWWTRNTLSRVANDKNHYVVIDIEVNNREVYSLRIKTSNPDTTEEFAKIEDVLDHASFILREPGTCVSRKGH
ncbi:MAG: glycoside hydrolase family 26 [Peptococcaceae bacterium]|jgi:hypothetical protein|nr:glycoside hydrolase family 26 [Peptococcaceae bacterium]